MIDGFSEELMLGMSLEPWRTAWTKASTTFPKTPAQNGALLRVWEVGSPLPIFRNVFGKVWGGQGNSPSIRRNAATGTTILRPNLMVGMSPRAAAL